METRIVEPGISDSPPVIKSSAIFPLLMKLQMLLLRFRTIYHVVIFFDRHLPKPESLSSEILS